MQLASALLEVLQSFKEQNQQCDACTGSHVQPKRPVSRESATADKTKGPQSVSLASRLLSVLQDALKQGWSDSKVADRLGQKLQAWVSSRTPAGERTAHASAGNSGSCTPPRQVSLQRVTKEDNTLPTNRSKPEAVPAFAAALNATEWNQVPQVTSLIAVRKALEQGDPLPGNIMVSQDPRLWYDLRDLFAAHGVHEEFTFACPASPQSLAPALAVWWRSPKQSQRPSRIKLDIHQMSQSPGAHQEDLGERTLHPEAVSSRGVQGLCPETGQQGHATCGGRRVG